ncbi:globin-coupled sensor protein [Bosea sp. Root381]|uniref:globin-coupled sensor protein n=1 Tax=Bosea sp. Root381 TaxID=1736524 RepID=UPI0006F6FC02|nr:globin-coupled sensor protein [Bosea sp. Root381]
MSLFGSNDFGSPQPHAPLDGSSVPARSEVVGGLVCPCSRNEGEKPEDIAERLHFAGIDDGVRALLREFGPAVATRLPAILDELYEHILTFPAVARLFPSPAIVARARQMQIAHWALITTGAFDDSYVRSVRRVGEVHCRLGLEPRWYIGGYNFIVARLITVATRDRKLRHLANPHRQRQVAAAFSQAAMLDMDLALSVYLEAARRNRCETLEGLAANFERAVASVVRSLTGAANDLHSLALSLADSSSETMHRADAALTRSLDATANIEAVASATDQLTESLTGVSERIASSSRISTRAVKEAQHINEQVSELTQSVDRIGGIVDVIREIAGGTKLLALNATIEAARAGQTSRGFSVVASEIKTLAVQTAEATAEIDSQIGAIREATRNVAAAVGGIRQTIADMNDIASLITAAVDQQAEATRKTACKLQQAWLGSAEVANNVMGVTRQASESSGASAAALSATTELARQAQSLTVDVEQFLETVGAA